MSFDAFVSYSHAADGQLAPALQWAIQRFAKPWYRTRALRVFRDESALSANPHLWSSIQTALDESDWFILLASPAAVASEWVNRELDHWLSTKSQDRILVVLTDGTWEWDATAHALTGTAVPPLLREVFTDEPRHLDLRWARAETDLDMRNARFRDGVAQLASPVRGIPKDELESEDILLHRRALRLARGGVTVLVLLVVIALVASGFALVQRREALTQRDRANHNAEVAVAERLSAVAASRRGIDDRQALLLAVEGYRRLDTTTTRSALLGTLTAAPQLVGFMPGSADATTSAISPDGGLVAAGTDDGSVRFWDTRTRGGSTVLAAPPAALRGVPVVDMAFDHTGTRLFVLHSDGEVELFNPATRRPVVAPMAIGVAGASFIAVRPDGREVVVDDAIYDVAHRRPLRTLSGAGGAGFSGRSAFSADGTTLFASTGGTLHEFDDRTLRPIGAPLVPSSTPTICLATSCYLYEGDADVATATTREDGSHHTLVLVDHGPNPAAASSRSLEPILGATVLDASTRRVIERLAPTLTVTAIAMSSDARVVVLGGDDGTIEVWPARDAEIDGATEPAMHQGGRIVSLSLADDGTSLVATSVGGSTVLWDLSGNGAVAGAHALPNARGLFTSSTKRSCSATESPINTIQTGRGGSALFSNDTCSAGLSMSPTGSNLAVSGDRSSVWDLATRPAELVRTFGDKLAPIATPLAFDPMGKRVLFAVAFSLPTRRAVGPGSERIGKYEIASVDGGQPEEVLRNVSVVSDPNDGPYLLVVKHGIYPSSHRGPTFVAMDVWTGRTLGSFRPRSVVDQLARAREEEVFDAPQSGIRTALAALPRNAIVDAQGKRAVTVSAYGDIVLWDLRSSRPVGDPIIATGRAVPAATAVAFSPDGTELAVGRLDGTVERYAVPSLRPVGPAIAGHSTPIGQIAYQPSGSLLAAASADGVDLIDRVTGVRIATLPDVGATPLEAAFGSVELMYGDGTALFGEQGRVLVTNGYGVDVPALLVSLVPTDWAASACEAAGRNLTQSEWTQLVGTTIPYDRTCPEWPPGE